MKNQISTFIILLFASTLFAQATEGEKPMSLGLKNGLSIELKDAKVKDVRDLWEDYMKQYDTKAKRDKKLDEYFSENAKVFFIPATSKLNIYARFQDMDKYVLATIFFADNDIFLSSAVSAEQMKGAQEFARLFDVFVKKDQTQNQLKEEQKKLKNLESDLKKLVKDNGNLHDDIDKYKDKIKKAEEDIVKNNADQDKANKIINDQALYIEQVQKRLEDLK